MFKDKIINKLTVMAKEKPRQKKIILLTLTLLLAVYHVFKKISALRTKAGFIFLSVGLLMLTSLLPKDIYHTYFCPTDLQQVVLQGDDGTLLAEEIDMSKFSADEADLIALAEETHQSATGLNGTQNDMKMAAEQQIITDEAASKMDNVVYDDATGQYIVPDFSEDWSLILVNKDHLIKDEYDVELGTIRGNIKCDIRIIDNVLSMITAAREDGIIISICSPYRDYDRQVMLFNRKVKSYMAKGFTEDEAYEKASETVAIPGTSEHQLGLAFDFISNNYTALDVGFAQTQAGKWLKEHSWEYGFILRYPEDKTEITDIQFEPWHYRYVGVKAAKEIMAEGLCLEEYVERIGL